MDTCCLVGVSALWFSFVLATSKASRGFACCSHLMALFPFLVFVDGKRQREIVSFIVV
jgi:hypothetical protein